MDPLLDRFLDALWLEDGLAQNTLAAYRRDLTALARWLAARGASVEGAGEGELAPYMASQHTATRATTANRRVAVLRRFYRWAQRERIVAADPTVRLRSARRPARFPQSISESQVESLLGVPDATPALRLRDRGELRLAA